MFVGAYRAWRRWLGIASPYLRRTDWNALRSSISITTSRNPTSTGLRLEYWRKSLGFFTEAPMLGTVPDRPGGLFERTRLADAALPREVIGNPHNQTLNVAVQWGLLGVVMLTPCGFAPAAVSREGLAAWIGLLVVVQNILSSLFNSHLFDFHEGWMYVLGVGVAGGMVLKPDRAARGSHRQGRGHDRLACTRR